MQDFLVQLMMFWSPIMKLNQLQCNIDYSILQRKWKFASSPSDQLRQSGILILFFFSFFPSFNSGTRNELDTYVLWRTYELLFVVFIILNSFFGANWSNDGRWGKLIVRSVLNFILDAFYTQLFCNVQKKKTKFFNF